MEKSEGAIKQFSRDLTSLVQARKIPSYLIYLIVVNFLFTLMRLQDFPALGFLGTIRLPGVLSYLLGILILPFFYVAKKAFCVKVLLVLLFFEGIRGVLGYFVIETMVVNDAWHFHTWQILLIYLFSLICPIIALLSNGRGLRLIVSILVYMGILLGAYSLTHSGFGPGGHIGDENDNCLFLVSILPFPFYYISFKRTAGSKVIGLTSFFLLLFGIIRTNSRGGFLGLLAVLAIYFILSKRKIVWIFSASIISLLTLPFVPQEYINEITSIRTEAAQGTGTIEERMHTWKIITRMWLDPDNILFGVGLENSKWNLYRYEGSGAGIYEKSLGGRATHSLYFQVIGDLGIWGIVIFLSLIFQSLFSLKKLYKTMNSVEIGIKQLMFKMKSVPTLKTNSTDEFNDNKTDEEILAFQAALLKEISFIKGGVPVIFSSWCGVLAAALGISVAYYPSFWLYCALSAAFVSYAQGIKSLALRLETMIINSSDDFKSRMN